MPIGKTDPMLRRRGCTQAAQGLRQRPRGSLRFLSLSRAPRPEGRHGPGRRATGRAAGIGAIVLLGLYTGAVAAGEHATAPIRIDGTGRGVTVTVDRAFCNRLTVHRPDADVTYQPGVDVDGNPVAPADLDGGYGARAAERALGRGITIDLGLPLERFGHFKDQPLGAAEVDLGQVTIAADGTVTWNGERLDDPAQNAIAAACARLEREGR